MLKGKKQLQARFRAIGQTEGLVRAILIHGVAEAKHLVPRKTGNLGRTIRVGTVARDGGDIRAGGVRNVGYARYVEFGTKGGTIITPKRARVLAWGGPRTLGGRLRSGAKPTHFAMRVKRGATKAQPFLRPGLEKGVRSQGLQIIVDLWNGAA